MPREGAQALLNFFKETQGALEMRRPGASDDGYRLAREKAKATYEEFKAEVARQIPNAR